MRVRAFARIRDPVHRTASSVPSNWQHFAVLAVHGSARKTHLEMRCTLSRHTVCEGTFYHEGIMGDVSQRQQVVTAPALHVPTALGPKIIMVIIHFN